MREYLEVLIGNWSSDSLHASAIVVSNIDMNATFDCVQVFFCLSLEWELIAPRDKAGKSGRQMIRGHFLNDRR